MKIAFITTDNREHERNYAAPTPYFGTAPAALLQGFKEMPDTEVHVISCTQEPMESPEKIARNIFYHSLLVPKWGWLRGAYSGCIRAVKKKVREIQPDIVHGQGTERYCALTAVASGFPNVLTIHGNMRAVAKVNRARPFSFLWLAGRLEALTVPRSNGVICLTSHTQRQVVELAKRTWIVPNAVDLQFFDRNDQPRPLPPQVLCVANILAAKNQVQLIRALDPLASETKFDLIFFGNTARGNPYVEEFMSLLASRPWCRFAGFADRPALKAALARAALLVLPTLEENCPMSVLEAMASGVPVAASNVGGVPDLITDGADGLLFEPKDAASIRSAVAKILTDGELAKRLVMAGLAKAERCFRPSAVAGRHIEIYRQILANQPKAKGMHGASAVEK